MLAGSFTLTRKVALRVLEIAVYKISLSRFASEITLYIAFQIYYRYRVPMTN